MTGSTQAQAQPADRPAADELEITLFGSGYGESIVVHTGNNKWLIVDSSINHDTKEPSALKYLSSIGVNVATQVIGVVVTHWHDDHIRGIGEIAEKCTSAQFYLSAALMCSRDSKKFQTLVLDSSISRLANLNADSNSGVSEFKKLFEILQNRDVRPDFALHDKLLIDAAPFHLYALAPHSSIFGKAIESIIAQIPDATGSVKRLAAPPPNFTSVVLWIKFGDERALLGADLEEHSAHPGWSLIISGKKPSIIDQKADLYKIAHHGSITGHHDDIWTQLLNSNPLSLVAPFNRNPKLPTKDDIERIKGLSENAYITSYTLKESDYKPSEDKHVKRKLMQRNPRYTHEAYSYIRARKKSGQDWIITTFGDACHLDSISDVA